MRTSLLLAALAVATSANALCLVDSECPGLPCAQGVCVGGRCGFDPALRRGRVCRGSAGACDPAEVCDGVHIACPDDVLAPSTTVCRPATGACDVAETCTGSSAQCPADVVLPALTVCNPSKGACDPAETCDGVHGECPPDALSAPGTVCRAPAGACDVAETCDGRSAACPADAFAQAGTVCRPAANDCDLAEACTGQSKDCPADSNAPSGTACENASACVAGGACAGAVCLGGKPELTFAPDPGEIPQDSREVTVTIKHTGVGAAITLTGARIDPSGTFQIAAAPQWPAALPSGAEQRVTVRLAAGAAPGDYATTLFVQASSCAEQPLHLHATVSPATDAGSGTPDAGTGGSAASAGGTGPAASGGGCSSTGAAPETLGLLALAALQARRRFRRPQA
jgi:hypothetical protein